MIMRIHKFSSSHFNQILTLGNYVGRSGGQPSARSDQSAIISSSLIENTEYPWAKLSFEFCRKSSVTGINLASDSSFIYAWANEKPTLPSGGNKTDLNAFVFPFHSGGYDSFTTKVIGSSRGATGSSNGALSMAALTNVWSFVIFWIMFA